MSNGISTTVTTSATPTPSTPSTMSTTGASGDVFVPLLQGIKLFRARVEGTDGDQRARLLAMPAEPALVPDVVRAVLDTLAKALGMLGDVLDTIDKYLITADSLLALIEAAGVAIEALGDVLDRDWPGGLGRARDAGRVLREIGGLLQGRSFELPPVIPRPETLLGIQDEIHALLGTEAEPGSLTQLIQALGTDA
jgi:hypothetical protein